MRCFICLLKNQWECTKGMTLANPRLTFSAYYSKELLMGNLTNKGIKYFTKDCKCNIPYRNYDVTTL